MLTRWKLHNLWINLIYLYSKSIYLNNSQSWITIILSFFIFGYLIFTILRTQYV